MTNRVIRMIWLPLALAFVVSGCGDDDAATTTDATSTTAAADLTKTPDVLTVGSDIPYPPFEDFDPADGTKVIGFDAGLITEIADRLDLTVVWVDTDFDTIFTQLATGVFDVVIAASTITPERALQVNFSDSYYNSQQGFIVNTTLTPTIDSTDDLQSGDSVAVQTGTTGADWAAANLAEGVEVREFTAVADAYNALESGQVTGVVSDEPSAVAEVANRAGIAIVEVIDTNEHYGIAVDPARTALLDAINQAFADMLDDGTYQEIYDTWFEAPAGSVLYTTPAPAAIGTAENPIVILLAPLVFPEDILPGTEILITSLESSLGMEFEAAVPNSYAETVTALCASPEGSIAILPAEAFVVASELCDAEASLTSLRFGYTSYWTEVVVARTSTIMSLADLDGLTWAYPEAGSTAGHLIPSAMFAAAGIVPGDSIAAGGHTEAVRAVYEGTADFATVRFSPNLDLEGATVWDGTQEGADVPADLVASCGLSDDGDLVCGTLRPRDARRGLRENYPDVIQRVRILTISDAIPNELIVFGGGFPADIRARVVEAMLRFSTEDPEGFVAAFEAFVWDGLEAVTAADVAGVRTLLAQLGFGLEDL
jgi:ABC-type amino acid transport substrate-binding protein